MGKPIATLPSSAKFSHLERFGKKGVSSIGPMIGG